jgi:phenylalanyl-tRNA synthetase alpha chain
MTPMNDRSPDPRVPSKDEINSPWPGENGWRCGLNQRLRAEWLDVTARADRRVGTIHPVSQVWEECTAIFAEPDFATAELHQIDTDWYVSMRSASPDHQRAKWTRLYAP